MGHRVATALVVVAAVIVIILVARYGGYQYEGAERVGKAQPSPPGKEGMYITDTQWMGKNSRSPRSQSSRAQRKRAAQQKHHFIPGLMKFTPERNLDCRIGSLVPEYGVDMSHHGDGTTVAIAPPDEPTPRDGGEPLFGGPDSPPLADQGCCKMPCENFATKLGLMARGGGMPSENFVTNLGLVARKQEEVPEIAPFRYSDKPESGGSIIDVGRPDISVFTSDLNNSAKGATLKKTESESFFSSTEPTVLTALTGKSAPAPLPAQRSCRQKLTDVDTTLSSGAASDSLALCQESLPRGPGRKKGLNAALQNGRPVHGMPGSGYEAWTPPPLRRGLGSIVRDFRFQPGSQVRLGAGAPGGGVSLGGGPPAPGTHAGGMSLGALADARFFPTGTWDARYVKGVRGSGTDAQISQSPKPYTAVLTLSQ